MPQAQDCHTAWGQLERLVACSNAAFVKLLYPMIDISRFGAETGDDQSPDTVRVLGQSVH
jgi:hypothetical protein